MSGARGAPRYSFSEPASSFAFNRGQRAFFFALGYLSWFVNAWVLIAATLAVLIVTVLRQFEPGARWVIGDRR